MTVSTTSAESLQMVRDAQHRSEWLQAWRRFSANRIAILGLVLVGILCLIALFADQLAPYDPLESMRGMRGVSPSWEHPFGFDHLGRDLFSRVIYGARVALLVGLASTVLSVTIGVLIGAVAGFFGGWVDTVLSRLIYTLMAFTIIAMLIFLAAGTGPTL
ncbi:peptide ABC transporter permease, partial [Litorilinea aerophila]